MFGNARSVNILWRRHLLRPILWETGILGQDYDVRAQISLEDAFRGTQIDLNLSVPDYDAQGRLRRVERRFKARIPKGATNGQPLRLRAQGGKLQGVAARDMAAQAISSRSSKLPCRAH